MIALVLLFRTWEVKDGPQSGHAHTRTPSVASTHRVCLARVRHWRLVSKVTVDS